MFASQDRGTAEMAADARLQNDFAGGACEADISIVAGEHEPVPDNEGRWEIASAAVKVRSHVAVGDVAGAGGIDRDRRPVAPARHPHQGAIVLGGGDTP